MATHSSILAWEIPWTEEPGGLQSMGLQSHRRLSTYMHAYHLSVPLHIQHFCIIYLPYYWPLEDIYFFLPATFLDIG